MLDLYEVDYPCSCLRINQQACDGAGHRQKRPLDGSVGLLSIISKHITTVSFVYTKSGEGEKRKSCESE